MAERPILFSGPMVRSILAGNKTQTRRVLKCQPTKGATRVFADLSYGRFLAQYYPYEHTNKSSTVKWGLCYSPYGQPGDRLWVRETLQNTEAGWLYSADAAKIPWYTDELSYAWQLKKSIPSIHMPRWASRITLEITNIRVERVQEITAADAWADGVRCECLSPVPECAGNIMAFYKLWDSINEKRGYGFDVNPWVWVIEFKRV